LAIVIKTTRRHVETAALAAAAAMLVALVADGLSLLGAPQARVQPQASLRCLLGSVTWAGACGLMMWAVLSGPWAAARSRFGGRWRGLLAAGVPALPLALALWWLSGALLDGQRISRHPLIVPMRWAAAFGSFLAPWLTIALCASARRNRTRVMAVGALLLAWVAAAVAIDRSWFPFLYPHAHLALWLSVITACALGADLITSLRVRPLGTWSAVGCVVVIAAAISAPVANTFDDHLASRELALRNTTFLRRLLFLAASPPPESSGVPDPEVMRRLLDPDPIPEEVLDRELPTRRSLSLLVLSFDGLRADHVTAELAPRLSTLQGESVTFERAWTPYPSTHGAFESAWRGRYPCAQDLRHASRLDADAVAGIRRHQPLAALCVRSGFQTHAITGFPRYLRHPFATIFDGFQSVELLGPAGFAPAHRVADRAVRLVRELPDEERALVWAHFFDPHLGNSRSKRDYHDYREAVSAADRGAGRVLDALEASGRRDDFVVVVFGDHGRPFRDRVLVGDVRIHPDVVRVPFSFRIPRVQPRRVGDPVDLTSLAPTITELLGLPTATSYHGRSMARAVLGETSQRASSVAFCGFDFPETAARSRGVATSSVTLVRDLWTGSESSSSPSGDGSPDKREIDEARALLTVHAHLAPLEREQP